MRESGLPGIGKIPYGFEVSRIKFIADIFGRIGFRGYTEQDFVDEGEGAITLSPSNLKNMKMTYDRCSYISWDKYRESPEIMIHDYDILMVKTGSTYGKSCLVENLPMEATINPQLLVYKNLKTDAKFFSYFLQTDYVSDLCELAVVGSTIPTMSQSKIGNFAVILPSKDVQVEISRHLDCCCAEIDDLVAVIQSQIDTLEQYKRSVITEAVTKGLDPDAEMRDSGIDFVGDIPAHWAVHPLYYYFGERKNKNIFGQETNLLSLSYGRIIRKDINSNGGLLPGSFNTYNVIEAGDIIIRPTDLQNDKRSLRTGLSKEHGIITSAYIALKPIKPINVTYFHYLLHAFDVMKVFYNMGNGVRQGLNFSEFSRLMVFEPTIEEQNAIVDALDKKCAEVDSVIADKKKQLETLDEYKKSLIFEYVTGKKKATMT